MILLLAGHLLCPPIATYVLKNTIVRVRLSENNNAVDGGPLLLTFLEVDANDAIH